MPRSKREEISEGMRDAAEQQIKDLQREIDYDLRDFTIDYIVKEFALDRFYIPDYQRKFVWDTSRKVRFVESVILGLPIPFMFFADTDDGRLEIIDGAQRIQTLESFVNDDLVLENLDKLSALAGFKFSDLPVPQQRKFENRALRVIILEDKTAQEIRHEIFDRINTAALIATPSEIRKGAYTGPFMDFINELSEDPLFLKLCPMSKSLIARGEPRELLLRFFAYSDRYTEFKHDVAEFLDEYVVEHRHDTELGALKEKFERMLRFVDLYFPAGFAKSKTARSTPRVRFEAISVGVSLALEQDQNLQPASMDWLDSEKFRFHTTTHASNSAPRLRGRIEFVRDSLLRVGHHD